ncbi:uracil-DNA glycosylase family protein [Mesorhizobium sp. BR1-1-9]|uniref:uracil-DNA glycosylase family protein n=1 Tax=Mesorhizobium sp. BR1-1-9 TaxID=2876646 RepID=UPI00398C8D6C
MLSFGLGLTTVVDRPTAAAIDVTQKEFAAGGVELSRKIARYRPRNIAFLGKPAYTAITRNRNVGWGRQDVRMAGATIWIVPNPSGRNFGFSLKELVEAYSTLHHAL